MPDNMAEMGSRMGERVDEMKESASGAVGKAKEYAGKAAKQAKEYAQQGYDYAAEKSKVVKDTTQGYIEENPWYAVGIALGVGVLLGLLLRGSKRD